LAVRKVVSIPGDRPHHNPIPSAVVLGNLILPSVVSGRNRELPPEEDTIEKQAATAFRRMKAVVEAAGGSIDNIGKVFVYMRDLGRRDAVNKEWLAMFPDENNRPARHAIKSELPDGLHLRLDFIAML
jgi:2-iminobutanoate/2-iminopropanoate deaminase